MSEDVDAFRRGLEAGDRGDIDGLLDELHPEIEWHSAMHVLMGGQETIFRGHAGVRRMIGDLYETFAEVRFEMSEFRDLGAQPSLVRPEVVPAWEREGGGEGGPPAGLPTGQGLARSQGSQGAP